MRTTFESGAWIEHTPIQDLKGKDRDAVSRSGRFTLQMPAELDPAKMQAAVAEAASHIDPQEFAIGQRNAVWARVITGWSFDLPVPVLENDGHVINGESIGELPLDDFGEIETLFAPYLAKLTRRPDPKGPLTATTSSSNGSPKAKATGSRKD